MNRIKDFFYNKNDIIVVLIILLVAAFIIHTRIEIIMDYPETLAEKVAASQSEQEAAENSISIVIDESDTPASAAKALYEAGLISSASDFKNYLKEQKKANSLKPGTFSIPRGSTEEEILAIITD